MPKIYHSVLGPFDTRAGVVQRSPMLADLMVHNRPGTSAYQLWSAANLNDAYGEMAAAAGNTGVGGAGCTLRMAAQAESVVMSEQIIARGSPWANESIKGQTRFLVDPTDLGGSDGALMFVRMQEFRAATGGYLEVPAGSPLNAGLEILGPISVIPPASFYSSFGQGLTLQGLAPGRTGGVAGVPVVFDPAGQIPWPMMIWLPRPQVVLDINNLDAGETLLVTTGLDFPWASVLAGESVTLEGGGRMILVAGAANAAVPFTLNATFRNGGM